MGFFDNFINSVAKAAEQATEKAIQQEAPAIPAEPQEMKLKFGTPEPVPYDTEMNGTMLTVFFNVYGNATVSSDDAEKVRSNGGLEALRNILTADIVMMIKEAVSNCSKMNIRYNLLPTQTKNMSGAIKSKLDPEWKEKYGISIDALVLMMPTITQESSEALKKLRNS